MTEVERRAGVPRSRLAALRLAELRELAANLGIAVPTTMRKGPLVAAITDHYDAAESDTDTREGEAPSSAPEAQQGVETVSTAESAVDEAEGGVEAPDAAPVETAEAATADAAPAVAEVEGAEEGEPETAASPTLVEPVEPIAAEAQEPGETATEAASESETVTSSESAVDEAAGGAEASDETAERTGTAQPRSASTHVNSGLTGIAEDLQELQRQGDGGEEADGQGESGDSGEQRTGGRRGRGRGRGRGQQGQQQGEQNGQTGQQQGQQPQQQQDSQPAERGEQQGQQQRGDQQRGDQAEQRQQQGQGQSQQRDQQQDGEGRRGRYRDRKRRGSQANEWDEPEIRDDDVLIPIAGILDVLDNYAFVRTSGYLSGPNDVYVSLGQVRKYHLRRGDAVVGAIRQVPEGEQPNRQKYNALVKVDSINGLPVADADGRVEFEQLTPLYPQERLRLETEPQKLTARVIDLVAPIGKGQRGLVVGPSHSGRTLLLQAVANAVTTNNPEAHLMVVLVDERPEEVTEMQRTVKGEVIASTFDRPAEDHTTVAELAVDRAKRLVELGYDVVVLLDSITRLTRAYDQTVPPSGRSIGGGLDPAALLPAKRFFGAARNIENGGSLTILATALTESGAKADEVVLQEFRGTANLELHLSGLLAEKRLFPAIDVTASGTRREEMLMGPDEVKVTWQLRRALASHEPQEALDVVLSQLRDSASNVEFLVQMQKSLPAGK